MKIGCYCGSTVYDQTDYLSNKGHIISDQDLFNLFDFLDEEVVDKLSNKEISREEAYIKIRSIFTGTKRLSWQCQDCGRLYIDSDSNKLECYVPFDSETEKSILKSKKIK